MLVVTYKAIEARFRVAPNIETGHFNAIAGIDRWLDVAMVIVIGRPLPSASDLEPLVGALFGRSITGEYGTGRAAVAMADGGSATLRVGRHPDPEAEAMRAAICDDEIIQAIGRGRGINRKAGNPLEVHVLADVALPLAHHAVQRWDDGVPDLMQRMLLDGIAVDSPAT